MTVRTLASDVIKESAIAAEQLMPGLLSVSGIEAQWSIDLTRQSRRIRVDDWDHLKHIPCLPDRLRAQELKDYGLTNLIHTDCRKKSTPWVRAGWYKAFDRNGRLYLLEVSQVVCGARACAWCIRPIFIVGARGELDLGAAQ